MLIFLIIYFGIGLLFSTFTGMVWILPLSNMYVGQNIEPSTMTFIDEATTFKKITVIFCVLVLWLPMFTIKPFGKIVGRLLEFPKDTER